VKNGHFISKNTTFKEFFDALYIVDGGLKMSTPRKIPMISDKNKKARLDWAKKFICKPYSYWEKLL
jgi:hypothetical protein